MKEIWKDVVGYEGLYQVSNLGNVKSLDRISSCGRALRGQTIKKTINTRGYEFVCLYFGSRKNRTVHQLVAESFMNHKPCGYDMVVNHINHNRTDNRISNLEIITQRQNSSKTHLESSSKYKGVCLVKRTGKWTANVHINGKNKFIGNFNNQEDAAQAYLCFCAIHNLH